MSLSRLVPGIIADSARYTARLARIAFGEKPVALAFLIVLSVLQSAQSFGSSKAFGWLVDTLAGAPGSLAALLPPVALFGGVMIAATSANIAISYLSASVFSTVTDRLDLFLRAALARLDIAHHEDPKFIDQIDKAKSQGINRSTQFLEKQLTTGTALVSFAFAAVSLAVQSWPLLLFIMVMTAPEAYVQKKFANDFWDFRTAFAEKSRYAGAFRGYFGRVAPLIELKLFRSGRHFLDRLWKAVSEETGAYVAFERRRANWNLFADISGNAGLILALGYFAYGVAQGDVTVGQLVFLFGMLNAFQNSLSLLSRSVTANYGNVLFLRDLFAVTDAAPRVALPARPVPLPPGTPEIAFEGVSFAYPGAEAPVLERVSFVIRPGEKVALIGLNGAGKTTLIKLLCRFYDPTEGRITIGGVDLREVDLDAWYGMLGALFQDFVRHAAMTAGEAIAAGDTERPYDEDAVRRAASDAEADAFISRYPTGLGQLVGKDFTGGTELSGGEWQKLALAHVFYRDPRVWILDEPTASVDAEAEAKIFDRLERLPADRTVIIISHRFSTVRDADRILVIEQGTVAEQGTHDELMARAGTYARLFSLQAGRYLAKGA